MQNANQTNNAHVELIRASEIDPNEIVGKASWCREPGDGKSSYPIKNAKTTNYNIKVYVHGGICWIKKLDVTRNQDKIDHIRFYYLVLEVLMGKLLEHL